MHESLRSLTIEYLRIAQLSLHRGNPRTHSSNENPALFGHVVSERCPASRIFERASHRRLSPSVTEPISRLVRGIASV